MDETDNQNASLQRWEQALTYVVIAVVIGLVASVGLGVSGVAKGLWSLATIGSYHTESFWNFLGADGTSPFKLFDWDKAIWLIVIIPTVLTAILGWINDFDAWLRKTPAERADTRRKADERAFEARRRERVAKEAAKAAKVTRKQERADRKPLSGWRRLWLVVSALLAIPTYLIAADANSYAFVTVPATPAMATLSGQEWIDEGYWSAQRNRRELRGCILPTTRVMPGYNEGEYNVSCDRRPVNVFFDSILWALLPAILLAAIGLTTRWVYRGFKRP